MYPDKEKFDKTLVVPDQIIFLEEYRRIIEFFIKKGYNYISPADLLENRFKSTKNILITFDDGYYNNSFVYPLLQRYKTPALFFISGTNIQEGKGYWWNSLYRELKRRNIKDAEIYRRLFSLKDEKTEDIERYLNTEFGKDSLNPITDLDRPFKPLELKDFAMKEYVYIGNHTMNHSILTMYNDEVVNFQVKEAQRVIYDITGISPSIIAYPNGNYSKNVITLIKKNGIKMGMTVDQTKNYLPLHFTMDDQFKIGRFDIDGRIGLEKEYDRIHSDINLYKLYYYFKKNLGMNKLKIS